MGLFNKIRGWFSMLIKSKAMDEFNIEPISSDQIRSWINECVNIYQGNPCWLDENDHIDTIGFARMKSAPPETIISIVSITSSK